MSADDLTELRLRLFRNGYHPVPVSDPNPLLSTAGKAPFMRNWQQVCALADEAEITRWTTGVRNHSNTGLLCGELVAVDLDLPVPELADRIGRMAEEMLGSTPMHKVGKKPKSTRCYRTDVPMKKMETPELLLDDGTIIQVEVMGVGQQIVGYGTHPGTMRPYYWVGASPEIAPFSSLPIVLEPQLRAFLIAAEAVLREVGGRTKKEREKADKDAAKAAAEETNKKAKAGHSASDNSFFKKVNRRALDDIPTWFCDVFPTAWHEAGTGCWRVSSEDLGRSLEEDISVHPEKGGQDFGTRQSCSPIDLVIAWGGKADATQAALCLCDKLGVDPASLGWKPKKQPSPEARAKAEKAAASAIAAVVIEFNKKYMVINEAGKAVVYAPGFDTVLKRRRFDRLSFDDLTKLYMNQLIEIGIDEKGNPILKSAAQIWLRHTDRLQYIGGITFDPSNRDPKPDVLNLWQGFAVTSKRGDWSLLRQHIECVICGGDKQQFDYLMGWMARLVQHPAEQGEVAVVLKGGEGTGKGTLAKALLTILGHHGFAISNAKHLIGNFNGHLRDAIFLFADEAFFAGDKVHVGTLKSLITEPYLTVEAKFQNAVQVPNFLHVFMASNEEWVVPASLDARRFFVLEVLDTVKGDHTYFGKLSEQMKAGGYEAMLDELLAFDLTMFNVRAVPATAGLDQQRKLSLPVPDAWWKDCLERAYVFRSKLGLESIFAHWHEEVTTELLFASYSEFADRMKERHPLSREHLGRFMRRMGAKAKRLSDQHVGEHMTDVVVNKFNDTHRKPQPIEHPRPPGYSIGSLELSRKAFNDVTGLSVMWEPPDTLTEDRVAA